MQEYLSVMKISVRGGCFQCFIRKLLFISRSFLANGLTCKAFIDQDAECNFSCFFSLYKYVQEGFSPLLVCNDMLSFYTQLYTSCK